MILLQGNGIARTFGGDVLFENINFNLQDHSRMALVGRNGAGKSTLLKIIAGVEEPSAGSISKVKDLHLNYLAQDTGLSSELTIFEEMLTVFEKLRQTERQLRQMELQMSELTGDDLESLMHRYDALSEEFRQANGFTYEAEIKSVLNGFRFDEKMWDRAISSLSGGQKTRLALAKMLLEKPDLLILDEPTNHLDIETLAWLETYLKNYSGSLLIVSHDRYFLDKVVTETLEISRGKLTRFAGNYSKYIELKAEMLATEQKNYDKQQKEIEKLEDFVARNMVRASTTKRAQSRQKKLEKMERIEAPTGSEAAAHMTFSPAKKSGNIVLTVEDAAVGYDKVLAEPINIDTRKHDAIAIVGPNGIGKTTLIKSIIGQIPLLKGQVKLGANVDLGYYDQEQGALTPSNSVLDEIWNEHRLLPEVEIRNLLGAFLFSGEDVKKTVSMLSGGEKARLLLAKLAMQHDNFLVLDEPTNHLDIDSREVLENSLIDFDGTLLFVSHDRYFINRVATKVLEISPQGSKLYLGDYDYYLEKKRQEEEMHQEVILEEKTESSGQMDYAQQKEAQKIRRKFEREVNAAEEKLADLEQQSEEISQAMLDITDDFVKLGELQAALDQLAEQKEETEMNLLEAMESLESL
ncbi:ABC-F family ATP-binding cassette domain-containing protein [Lactococcus formosensis]|uniref:ABC-F family ATP-binding cassette domain-containing protein n=1 Tax=Lactococcus formosensis TaxID=1281486 RepID=UPI002435598B|nr:ABC-F family ATP-binding cassette domain-containing protein [Lactococcus formosensis]MDG6126945.1 ABC-F family ATP-binding cassette domain-containing protein [Lactococcus formosensis]MDG6188010.1 ABC-F family ATP-binding cassette domain-containing protein [Lactococcus formosensis]MDG6190342.1 ABC-F family ATP-binding cassette domain-containing protein [Lactococcus formosensis]